jgi:hypothetical protein
MLQPLDVAVFSPFKQQLNSEIYKYSHSHQNTIIARQQLPPLISTTYQNSLTVTSIMPGFRKTGIFTFDPEAVKIKPPTLELPATKTTKHQAPVSPEIKIFLSGILLRDVNTICRRSWYIAAHVWEIYDFKIEVVPFIIHFSSELNTVVKFEV